MARYAVYQDVAKALGVDAVALVPGPNFTRLFQHSFMSHERPFVVIIPRDGPPAALVPNLELLSFEAVGFEGRVYDWRDQDGYDAAFGAMMADLQIGSLAVEGQVMRVFVHHALRRAAPDLRILDAEAEISALRLVKTESEIKALEDAIAISETALAEVLASVRIGESEKDVEARLIGALFAHGADGLAFPPIVATGANSAKPHAHARSDGFLVAGQALLFDFGAIKDGLNADMTRTVFVGEPAREDRDLYETVLAANARGHEVARPGCSAHDIDDAVTAVLEGSPFAEHIRHKTGHGLGREVHEAPQIMRDNRHEMRDGYVFTNEPGLYRPGRLGVRIEDDILITATGNRSLTGFPKELTVIG